MHAVSRLKRRNVYVNPIVPEHFSSPLLQFAKIDAGQTFTLVECPSTQPSYDTNYKVFTTCGTGQLISRLTVDEIDIAM